MTRIRALTLLAVVLTLLVSACNQNELRPETLSPQFGETTPGVDDAQRMAASVDGVYVGGRWNNRPALIKFGRSGNIPWVKTLPGNAGVRAVTAGPGSVLYIVYSLDDVDGTRSFFVRRYSQTGTVLWTRGLASGVEGYGATAATDKYSNVYLTTPVGSGDSTWEELRKYKPEGNLVWSKRVADSIYDLDVSANGFVHTVSGSPDAQMLSRYTPNGGLLWRVSVPHDYESQSVAVGREGEIYVASNDEVYPHQWFTTLTKYGSRGTQLWQRSVQNSIGLRLDGLDADDQGNAYLALTNPNWGLDQSRRFKKFYTYSPGGKRLLLREFDFGSEQPLVGPVALSPSEVYLAISGVGNSAQEGLLLRLDGLTGSVTWQR